MRINDDAISVFLFRKKQTSANKNGIYAERLSQ